MRNNIKLLKWMFSFTKEYRTGWVFSRIAPLVFNVLERSLEALSFRQLFILFESKDINPTFG